MCRWPIKQKHISNSVTVVVHLTDIRKYNMLGLQTNAPTTMVHANDYTTFCIVQYRNFVLLGTSTQNSHHKNSVNALIDIIFLVMFHLYGGSIQVCQSSITKNCLKACCPPSM